MVETNTHTSSDGFFLVISILWTLLMFVGGMMFGAGIYSSSENSQKIESKSASTEASGTHEVGAYEVVVIDDLSTPEPDRIICVRRNDALSCVQAAAPDAIESDSLQGEECQ